MATEFKCNSIYSIHPTWEGWTKRQVGGRAEASRVLPFGGFIY